jgi:hypothetical protein
LFALSVQLGICLGNHKRGRKYVIILPEAFNQKKDTASNFVKRNPGHGLGRRQAQ